ncbi:unnamed protein product [Soboliphyme baturini]|uniref:UDENN domain-containing protein n=1 Tax=Soboliphyme baturini TaxID=241478 RepID=A0A183J0G6_9BILA|nr:unnamed protein product [Soboliphyme baturini]
MNGKITKSEHLKYNESCPYALQIDPDYYFGFVYFRQVKCSDIPRGYFQKSLILLTELPLINFFSQLLNFVAPNYFLHGKPVLESVFSEISAWDPPVSGVILKLFVAGHVIKEVDSSLTLPAVHEPDLFKYFLKNSTYFFVRALLPWLPEIQLLWELIFLGEPVVVMASSPTVCSSVVQSLISLIWPLKYGYDYRPFFTIQDNEFKEYTSSKLEKLPNVVLGVTNPFFIRRFENWPNVLRLVQGEQNAVHSKYLSTLYLYFRNVNSTGSFVGCECRASQN